MSRDQYDWHMDVDGIYRRSARSYDAEVEIQLDGSVTLTITGVDAPAPANYPTRRLAMDAFRHFLADKPVA